MSTVTSIKETRRKYFAQFYSENSEQEKARNARYRQENKEKIKASKAEYYKRTKQARKLAQIKWRKDNPDKVKAIQQKRRANKLQAPGHFTGDEFTSLCVKYGNTCLNCKEAKDLTADHVIPLSKGGTNYIGNIQPLCSSCNSKKATSSTDYRS